MGDYKAGVALVILLIGYLALFSIVTLTSAIAADYSGNFNINVTGTGAPGSMLNTKCEFPRSQINPETGETEEIKFTQKNSAECRYTTGSFSEERCGDIAGCNWVNETIEWWFFTQSSYCNGTLDFTNISYFTNQTETFFKVKLSDHDPNTMYILTGLSETTQYIQNATGDVVNAICPLFDNDALTCGRLGCTFVSGDNRANEDAQISSTALIWSNIAGIFTFSVDIDLDSNTDYYISIIFYMLNIVTLIVLYYMSPFIH